MNSCSGNTQEAALKHTQEAISLWRDTELETEGRLPQETPTSRTFRNRQRWKNWRERRTKAHG